MGLPWGKGLSTERGTRRRANPLSPSRLTSWRVTQLRNRAHPSSPSAAPPGHARAPASSGPSASPPGPRLLFTSQPGGSFRSGRRLGGDSSGRGGGSHTQVVATLATAGGLCLSPAGESPTPLCPGAGRLGGGPPTLPPLLLFRAGVSSWHVPAPLHRARDRRPSQQRGTAAAPTGDNP